MDPIIILFLRALVALRPQVVLAPAIQAIWIEISGSAYIAVNLRGLGRLHLGDSTALLANSLLVLELLAFRTVRSEASPLLAFLVGIQIQGAATDSTQITILLVRASGGRCSSGCGHLRGGRNHFCLCGGSKGTSSGGGGCFIASFADAFLCLPGRWISSKISVVATKLTTH